MTIWYSTIDQARAMVPTFTHNTASLQLKAAHTTKRNSHNSCSSTQLKGFIQLTQIMQMDTTQYKSTQLNTAHYNSLFCMAIKYWPPSKSPFVLLIYWIWCCGRWLDADKWINFLLSIRVSCSGIWMDGKSVTNHSGKVSWTQTRTHIKRITSECQAKPS